MKYCKDCKHCDLGRYSTPPPQWPKGPALHYWCDAGIDPVSGNPLNRYVHCHERRKEGGDCGPEAKLFEPRE